MSFKPFTWVCIVLILVIVVALGGYAIYAQQQKKQHKLQYKEFKDMQEPLLARIDANVDTIFVSVPSYRDPDLVHTIVDLFDKALCPQRIFVGICEQNAETDSRFWEDFARVRKQKYHFDSAFAYHDNIKVCEMDAKDATGPSLARSIIEKKLYSGQKYIFCIDSHMMFSPNWDQILIDDFTRLSSKSSPTTAPSGLDQKSQEVFDRQASKIILTMYPPDFNVNERQPIVYSLAARAKQIGGKTPGNNKRPEKHDKSIILQNDAYQAVCNSLYPQSQAKHMCFSSFSSQGFPQFVAAEDYSAAIETKVKITQGGRKLNATLDENRSTKGINLPCLFWSACCSFTLAKTHLQVPYVNLPYLFIGEEFLMAALFWTHGYRFYTPSSMVVRHRWSREGRPLFFDNYMNDAKKTQECNASYDKLRDFFGIWDKSKSKASNSVLTESADLKPGSLFSIDSYLKWTGVNLNAKTVEKRTYFGLPPVDEWDEECLTTQFGSLENVAYLFKLD